MEAARTDPLRGRRRRGGAMLALAALPATMAVAAACMASGTPPATLSCVPQSGCGCATQVDGASCPADGAHFFHALEDGAPLLFDAGEGPVTALSTEAPSDHFSPGPGDAWTTTYRHGGGQVEIRYSPGADTCAKRAQGEQCEYFDVRARVLMSGPQGTRVLTGTGSCGC